MIDAAARETLGEFPFAVVRVQGTAATLFRRRDDIAAVTGRTPALHGQLVRDAFPNNTIASNRMDKVALGIQQLIPVPDNGALTGNFTPSFVNDRVTTNESVKLDEYLNTKAKLSGYFGTNATGAQYS